MQSDFPDGDAARTWAVLCDFDGTISRLDATDALLHRYALPGWESLESRWIAGEITALECMQGQVALLSASPSDLMRFAGELPADESFPEFVTACAAWGFPLVIASDGIDRLIHSVLKRLGLTGTAVCSGALESMGDDRYRLRGHTSSANCVAGSVTCKCATALRLAATGSGNRRRVLLVGDGRSDFCVAANVADAVLARGQLLAYCRERDIPCAPFDTFAEAARLLSQLAQGCDAPAGVIGDQQLTERSEEPWLQN